MPRRGYGVIAGTEATLVERVNDRGGVANFHQEGNADASPPSAITPQALVRQEFP
jgi:hypothetical protein